MKHYIKIQRLLSRVLLGVGCFFIDLGDVLELCASRREMYAAKKARKPFGLDK